MGDVSQVLPISPSKINNREGKQQEPHPVKSDITTIFELPGEEGSLAHVAIGRFFNHLPDFKQKGVKSFAAVTWRMSVSDHAGVWCFLQIVYVI